MISHIIKCSIIPKFIISDKKLLKIKSIENRFYKIDKIEVLTEHKKIKEVWIHNAFHPNAINDDKNWNGNIDTSSEIPPDKVKFCIPDYLFDLKYDFDSIKMIVRAVEIINYDNSYFTDYQNIKVKEN